MVYVLVHGVTHHYHNFTTLVLLKIGHEGFHLPDLTITNIEAKLLQHENSYIQVTMQLIVQLSSVYSRIDHGLLQLYANILSGPLLI
jgi:hypothetical protein